MQRSVSGIVVSLSLALVIVTPFEARSLGVYSDAAEEAGFLYARHQPTLGAALNRTRGGHPDASMFSMSAAFPVRRNVLVRVDEPFIALIGGPDTDSGFGDLVAHARVDIGDAHGHALRLLASARFGTGSVAFFPFASQSIDLTLGVGYVDTVSVARLWVRVEGTAVFRAPEGLDEDARHEDSMGFGAGLGIDVVRRVALRGGGMGELFKSGGNRWVAFSQVGFSYTPAVEIYAGISFELGDSERRVDDTAITAGIHTFF